MNEDWLHRARREIERLRGADAQRTAYCDFIIEAERRQEGDVASEAKRTVDAPQLPSRFRSAYVSNIPGIALPNGRFLFFCRASQSDTLALLQEPAIAEGFRGTSWRELFCSRYEFWPFVFDAETERRTLSGEYVQWRCKFTELQPGDRSIKAHVPGVFAGDEVPSLDLSEDQRRQFVPRAPVAKPEPDDFDPTRFVLFLVDGFGVDLDGRAFLELNGGAFWWCASAFPLERQILRPQSMSREARQPFTGVLGIPRMPASADREATLAALQEAQVRAKRLRLLLNILTGARMALLGDAFAEAHQQGVSTQIAHYHRLPYEFAQGANVRQSRFSASVLVRSAEIALKPSARGLLQYVHRALDSIELARSF